MELLEPRQLLATIRVTSLSDSTSPPVDGLVTLREAITSINAGTSTNADVAGVVSGAYSDQDRIVFDGLSGTIALAGNLPAITRAVGIDGSTGAGFSGTPALTIDAGGASAALTVQGPDVAVRSLALINGGQAGVLVIGGDGDRGGDHGELRRHRPGRLDGEQPDGIRIDAGASAATVGGAAAGERNVISGNAAPGC